MVCRSYTYCRLDGSMKIEDRGAIVSKFNSDPSLFVFLISKKLELIKTKSLLFILHVLDVVELV